MLVQPTSVSEIRVPDADTASMVPSSLFAKGWLVWLMSGPDGPITVMRQAAMSRGILCLHHIRWRRLCATARMGGSAHGAFSSLASEILNKVFGYGMHVQQAR
jgi:hypothetical protein